MGQQQLLLLVLGIIIVGVALIVGIQAFSENQKKSNADSLTLTSMRIASAAQTWLSTPASLGGGLVQGALPGDFTGVSLQLDDLGFSVDTNGDYIDQYGTYSATVSSSDLVITARSASTSGGGDNNVVCVYVRGPKVADLSTTLNPSGGSC